VDLKSPSEEDYTPVIIIAPEKHPALVRSTDRPIGGFVMKTLLLLAGFLIAPNGGGPVESNTSVFDICATRGIVHTAVEQTTWGAVKARYR
jgi:hypothetical protein